MSDMIVDVAVNLQAQAMSDETLAARMDFDLHLALLQQEVLTGVNNMIDNAAVAPQPPFPVDLLTMKQAQLQLQSLSASDLFNSFAMVRSRAEGVSVGTARAVDMCTLNVVCMQNCLSCTCFCHVLAMSAVVHTICTNDSVQRFLLLSQCRACRAAAAPVAAVRQAHAFHAIRRRERHRASVGPAAEGLNRGNRHAGSAAAAPGGMCRGARPGARCCWDDLVRFSAFLLPAASHVLFLHRHDRWLMFMCICKAVNHATKTWQTSCRHLKVAADITYLSAGFRWTRSSAGCCKWQQASGLAARLAALMQQRQMRSTLRFLRHCAMAARHCCLCCSSCCAQGRHSQHRQGRLKS